MAERLWFKVDFQSPKGDAAERQHYESYWRGYIAYHDEHVDRAARDNRHGLRFQWDPNYSHLDVYLDPLLNPTANPVTYTLPAVSRVYSGAASSDPPLPPPPPIRRS